MPDYSKRDEYPDLVKDAENVEWSFLEQTIPSFELNNKLGAYYNKLNCESSGSVTVSFVVTKNAQVDAPIIEKSLSENCDKAILMGLQFLKFNEAPHKNGKPINFLTTMRYSLHR